MIDLLETQIDGINLDERSIEENIDFMSEAVESILITRRDSFKEQMTRLYKDKDDEVLSLRDRINQMLKNDEQFEFLMGEKGKID
jgi:hypothetical protein